MDAFRFRFQVYSYGRMNRTNKERPKVKEFVVELDVIDENEQAAMMKAAYRAYQEFDKRYMIEMLSCKNVTEEYLA